MDKTKEYLKFYNDFENVHIHPNALNTETFGQYVWNYKENEQILLKSQLERANELIKAALQATNGGRFMGHVLKAMKNYDTINNKE